MNCKDSEKPGAEPGRPLPCIPPCLPPQGVRVRQAQPIATIISRSPESDLLCKIKIWRLKNKRAYGVENHHMLFYDCRLNSILSMAS